MYLCKFSNISNKLLSSTARRYLHRQNASVVTNSIPSTRSVFTSSGDDKCKLAIFDKDGTLVCFHAMWGPWTEVKAKEFEMKSGLTMESMFYEFMNYDKVTKKYGLGGMAELTNAQCKDGLIELLVVNHNMTQEEARDLVESTWTDTFELDGHALSHAVKPLADTPEIFNELKEKDIQIAICSSDTRASVLLALGELKVLDMVDRVMCGDDLDNVAKPAPDNVYTLCHELNVSPKNTAMIGDTPTDVEMGLASGCRGVYGVLSGVCKHDELSDAHHVCETIADTVPFILGHAKPANPLALSKFGKQLFHTSTRSMSTTAYSPVVERKEFSHIIVGAGSAGCVLANRLTEDESNSILLLEAGPKDTTFNMKRINWKIHMPAAMTYNLCDDKFNWFYHTEPQKYCNNRVMYWPRGRVWGGSSSLNAMVYIRGHAEDYNRWHREGATGWDYDHCLPYFRKAQCHELGGDTYRGGDGPLHVTQGNTSNPLDEAFIEAGLQAGYPKTSDMNGFQQEGLGVMDMTVHKGMRWNTASAYLRPALERSNLDTEIRCMTTKVIFNGNKAIGVEVLQDGKLKEYYATNEVILSGGAINSPQLLMVSGIGNADELRQHGISVVQHLPGVGENLQDHLELYVQVKCNKPITLYSAQQPVEMLKIGIEWMLQQTGPCATTHMHVGGFIRSAPGKPHPDVQYHFVPSQVIDHGRLPPECHAYQAHAGTLREVSVGWMKLRSRSPFQHPIIQPNYLQQEEDLIDLRNTVKLTREIFKQKAFDEFRGEEIQPGNTCETDADIDEFIRNKAETAYHPSCTCKMGSDKDPMAVVDNQTKVFGTENLRVVDSSIMPSVVSGNLNAPTIMIAERAADIIRGRDFLHSPNAPVYQPKSLQTQR